ncbi:hypothetical protein IWX46DRAFT_584835 [Phyllosticta citricarpa]|uniref:Uncharacterized protein n=1 Tax=Phyllosticta citricarpa TaxID=55181 RepID=A0ABR1LFS2_9PEZI
MVVVARRWSPSWATGYGHVGVAGERRGVERWRRAGGGADGMALALAEGALERRQDDDVDGGGGWSTMVLTFWLVLAWWRAVVERWRCEVGLRSLCVVAQRGRMLGSETTEKRKRGGEEKGRRCEEGQGRAGQGRAGQDRVGQGRVQSRATAQPVSQSVKLK